MSSAGAVIVKYVLHCSCLTRLTVKQFRRLVKPPDRVLQKYQQWNHILHKNIYFCAAVVLDPGRNTACEHHLFSHTKLEFLLLKCPNILLCDMDKTSLATCLMTMFPEADSQIFAIERFLVSCSLMQNSKLPSCISKMLVATESSCTLHNVCICCVEVWETTDYFPKKKGLKSRFKSP